MAEPSSQQPARMGEITRGPQLGGMGAMYNSPRSTPKPIGGPQWPCNVPLAERVRRAGWLLPPCRQVARAGTSPCDGSGGAVDEKIRGKTWSAACQSLMPSVADQVLGFDAGRADRRAKRLFVDWPVLTAVRRAMTVCHRCCPFAVTSFTRRTPTMLTSWPAEQEKHMAESLEFAPRRWPLTAPEPVQFGGVLMLRMTAAGRLIPRLVSLAQPASGHRRTPPTQPGRGGESRGADPGTSGWRCTSPGCRLDRPEGPDGAEPVDKAILLGPVHVVADPVKVLRDGPKLRQHDSSNMAGEDSPEKFGTASICTRAGGSTRPPR